MYRTTMKRGLAATAISALTITGIPMLAGSASAAPVTNQVSTVTLLSQSTGQASLKNDGTDTTVRLEAAAPANISSVTFQYSVGGGAFVNVPGATVQRNDDGAFSFEWDLDEPQEQALIGATVTLRVTGTPTAGPAQTDQENNVVINGAGAGQSSVNLAQGSALGVFQTPYAASNGAQNVVVSGTTSATSGDVHIADSVTETSYGTVPVSVAQGAATGTFAGVVDIDGYTYSGTNDQFALSASLGSDDVESYTLYQQTIDSVTAVPGNPNVPANGTTGVTVTVLDSQQKPVAGARVASNAGGPTKFTNAKGQATFTQNAGDTTFYYADATDATGFQQALGDKKSADVAVGQFVPAPTSLEATSADGVAFDLDEYGTDDVTVQVKDQNNGDLDANDNSDLSYYWVVTPFDGSPATQRIPVTGNDTVATDDNGEFIVPLPTPTDASGTYELYAGLTANPNTGTGAIAQSKVLTVKAGEADVTYDPSGDQSAPAGGEVALTASLALEDGTGLPNRDVDVAYARGTVGSDTVPDAGIVPATGSALTTSRTFTTGAAGNFSVTVDDPAETPQGTEVGGSLESDNGFIDPSSIGIDFAGDEAPTGATVTIDPITATATPGQIITGTATVELPDGPDAGTEPDGPVPGQRVTLSTDTGFFTNGTADPSPAVGTDAGEYSSRGQSITLTSNAQGEVTFNLVVERDEDFDDDGLATAVVTASAGASATDTEDVDLSSSDPLNGGEVLLTVSPESEQDGSTDPARTGQDVAFDVAVTDQFGNLVGGELVTVSEDGDDAAISGTDEDPGTAGVQVKADFEDDGDFTVTSTEDDDVDVTASWTTDTYTYTSATGDGAPTTGTETLTDTETVSFFEVNLADAEVTMTGDPENAQLTGGVVNETVTVLDSQGRPISGLQVTFTRFGPGSQDPAQVQRTTNANGQASYAFVGTEDGSAVISAEITDGSEVRTVTDKVLFATVGAPKADIIAKLKARNNGDRRDKIKIVTRERADGAKVKLIKVKNNGKKKVVGKKTLNGKGKTTFFKKDRNGRKRTKYYAVVRPTQDTKRARTNNRRVV